MFAKTNTRTKILAGFGITIVISAVVGFLAWNRLNCVQRLAALTDEVSSAAKSMLDARREEKNFALRGFEKSGSETKNSVEKWEENQNCLLGQLDKLQASSGLDRDERALVNEAISAAKEYGSAFTAIKTSRSVQNKAVEEWKSTGWAVTQNIEKATNEVITPARQAAEKARNIERLLQWERISRDLDSSVIKPFLILRTTAVYFIHTRGDQECQNYQTQLEKVKSGTAAWATLVKNHPELQEAAKEILSQLGKYEVAGKDFYGAVLQSRESETLMIAKARSVEETCQQIPARIQERIRATTGAATNMMVALVIAGVIFSAALAYFITLNISKTLSTMIGEVKRLSVSAVEGKLQARGNAELVSTEFRPIIEGVNATLDTLVGIIDNIPTPVLLMDRQFAIQYINDVGTKVIGLGKQEIVGTKCYQHFKTPHCNTANCACSKAMQQNTMVTAETVAKPGGRELEISYTGMPLRDKDGKVVGALEFVTDETDVQKAARVAGKVNDFQATESKKLTEALEKFAAGNLDFTVQVAEGDADTAGARKTYEEIAAALKRTADVVNGLIAEATTLAGAADQGRLDTRSDDSSFQGKYREIIQGMNKTLEAFATPMRDIGEVLKRLATKDFSHTVDAKYPGAYGQLRDNVNLVVESIRGAVEQITESANQFAEGSRVIAESSQTLASGSQEQSSSVQQVTASIEELSRSVQGVKDNAHEADKVSKETSQLAEQGGQAVRKSAEAMEQITHQLRPDRRDHPGDLRDRQPDQPVGPECGDRGGPGRRARHGLRRGGRRGPQTGRALQPGGRRDHQADQGVQRPGPGRGQTQPGDRGGAEEDRRGRGGHGRQDRRDRRRHGPAGQQFRGGLQGHPRHLPGDRAVRGRQRGNGLQQRAVGRPGPGPARPGGPVHDRQRPVGPTPGGEDRGASCASDGAQGPAAQSKTHKGNGQSAQDRQRRPSRSKAPQEAKGGPGSRGHPSRSCVSQNDRYI